MLTQEPQMKTTATQEQKQKVTVSGSGGLGTQLTPLLAWGTFMMFLVAFLLWLIWVRGGIVGMVIDSLLALIVVGSILWFLWTWGANRYYHTIRLATNSRVIETQHASVWFDGPDNYINFTAEIAREMNIVEPPAKEIEAWVPPSFEENYAKSVYEDKEHRGLTWEQIAEKHHTTIAIARGKHKEYIGMLERGRII